MNEENAEKKISDLKEGDRFDPGIDVQRIGWENLPKARHIYGQNNGGKKTEGGNARLEYYESLEGRSVVILKRIGNEFGTPITEMAKILNAGYKKLHGIYEGSEKFEVILLSQGDRVRIVRSEVGW